MSDILEPRTTQEDKEKQLEKELKGYVKLYEDLEPKIKEEFKDDYKFELRELKDDIIQSEKLGLVSPKEAMRRLRRFIKNAKSGLQTLKSYTRGKVISGGTVEGSEGMERFNFTLEKAFNIYLAKYQVVGFLEEHFKEHPEDEPANTKRLFNKTKLKLLDFVFDNIKEEDIPKNIDYYDKFPRPSNIPAQIERKTGLLRLTDEEAQDLIERQDYSHIYEGKNPLGKFTGEQKIKLLDHQKAYLNGFFLGNLRSGILYHGVGTGKTFSAVASVKLYLQLYPKGNVIIITPPAVLFNFIDSMIEYGINAQDRRLSFMSFDKFSRNKTISTVDSLLIIDEAHNLRTEIIGGFSAEEEEDDVEADGPQHKYNLKAVAKGKRPASFIVKGIDARKILMLTATPFVNTPYDIENLIAIGSSRPSLGKAYFGEMVSSNNFRYDYFKYRISKYDRNFKKGDFPEMREKYISIVAPKDTNGENDARLKALAGKSDNNPFYSQSRQAGLVIDKMKYCIDIIKKNPTKKFVIYSAYVFQGVSKIISLLNEDNISHGFITGGMNVKQIARYIDAYNNFNNPDYPIDKIRVLLISKAGSEGVNLLETRGIFVIDGVWNDALYEQIVARAVRYKSHKNLPENEQYVDVYKIFYCFDFEVPFIKRLDDGKGFDYQKFYNAFSALKKQKKKLEKENKLSKEDEKDIIREGTNKEKIAIASQSENWNREEFNKLKRGSAERKKYLEDNLKFGKGKAGFETKSQLSVLGNKIPSTDFYMFVLQKIKQNKINQFVKELIKIPMIEDIVKDIPKAKKLLEEINSGKLNEVDIINNLVSNLVGKEDEANEILKKGIKSGENTLQELIQKGLLLKEMTAQKAKARLRQEFFTPNFLVKEMIELSGLDKLDKYQSVNILEPSAGWGNIVRGCLLIGSKKKINMVIDMVEFEESNRKELLELQNTIPTAVSLQKQKNFLLFTPSKRYDYILMNPPFFLQKKNNKEYTRDIYDYDFVLRAYSMLELDGVLVAITGMKWKENKAIQKFYDNVDADIKEMKGVKWKGEEVKKGGEVSSLDITMIYIKKLVVNSKIDNDILQSSLKLFVDSKSILDDDKPFIVGGGGASGKRRVEDEDPAPAVLDEKPIPAPRKPKPKPKPPPILPRPEPVKLHIKETIQDLIKFNKGEPVNFECFDRMTFYLFLEVLRRNKNDCILGLRDLQGGESYNPRRGNIDYKSVRLGYFISIKTLRTDKLKEAVLKKYKECKKNKKIFCLPIMKAGHANMIVLNYGTGTIEYYEPHGEGTAPFNSAMKKLHKYFIQNGEPKMKLSLSDESCPLIPQKIKDEWDKLYNKNSVINFKYYSEKKNNKVGLQGATFTNLTRDERKETAQTPKGKRFTDTGGFCCMWSFLQMDFRLKHPLKKPNELANALIKSVKGNPSLFFRNYIRGFTFEIMKNLTEKLGGEDELFKFNQKSPNTDLINKFGNIIKKMYEEAGGDGGTEDEDELIKNLLRIADEWQEEYEPKIYVMIENEGLDTIIDEILGDTESEMNSFLKTNENIKDKKRREFLIEKAGKMYKERWRKSHKKRFG